VLCAWVQSLHLFIILLICFDGTHIVAHTALQVLCAWVPSLHLFIILLICFDGTHIVAHGFTSTLCMGAVASFIYCFVKLLWWQTPQHVAL